MIGHKLEGFNIVDKIKSGSIGEIWLAGKDKTLFALKMLYEHHASNPEKRRRFRREARIARALRHRNVIQTFGYYDADPRPFYVMEYFPSENLKTLIQNQRVGPMQRRLTILRQLCEAVNYIHSRNVLHRDLKPENILVAKNAMIKLIDFSIAQTRWDRLVEFFGRRASGSPSYMPPEQITNRKNDHRSDYYSLGILAFELLTERLPYTGPSMQAVFEKHLREKTPSIRAFNDQVSPEVDHVVSRLMQKRPERRPDTLSDIIYVLGKQEVKT